VFAPGLTLEEQQTREERPADAGALFRNANDQLRRRYAELALEAGLVPFICECANTRCTRTMRLTLTEYDDAHRQPRRFVIVPGHERLDGEQLVREEARFSVVERLPAGG
jgi:hypothetical protein